MSNNSVHMAIELDGEFAARMVSEFQNDLAGRLGVLHEGIGAALKLVARTAAQTAPKPGVIGYTPRTGNRASRQMLYRTIGHKVAEYIGTTLGGGKTTLLIGVVGPRYPAGAHGHLVEYGHRIPKGGTLVREFNTKWRKRGAPSSKRGFAFTGAGRVVGRTRPIPFMKTAVELTKDQVKSVMAKAMLKYVSKRNG